MALTTGQIVILIWFGSSVAVFVFGNAAFYFWLRAHGAHVRMALAPVPGHLGGMYVEWCRAHGHSPSRVLILRKTCFVNLVLATVFAATLLTAGM